MINVSNEKSIVMAMRTNANKIADEIVVLRKHATTIDENVDGGVLKSYVGEMDKKLNKLNVSLLIIQDSISRINPIIDSVYNSEYAAWKKQQEAKKAQEGDTVG